MKKVKYNTYRNTSRIKYFLFLIVFLMSIQLISGAEFDNKKYFDDKVGKYGKVRIENLWGAGSILQELELKTNTERCSAGCKSKINIELFKTGALIEDVRFLTRYGRDWIDEDIISYRFEILDGKKIVDDYVLVGSEKLDKNGTETKEYKKVGSHQEDNWKPYIEGDEYYPGNYTIRLIGNKPYDKIVDWQITSQGILIDDWAIWGSGSGAVLYYDFESDEELIFGVVNITNNTGFTNFTETGCLIGKCLRMGGANEGGSVVLNDSSGLDIITNGGTINFWINTANQAHGVSVFGYNPDGVYLEFDNAPPDAETYSLNGMGSQIVVGAVVQNATWHMITIFGNGSTYWDGVFNDSAGVGGNTAGDLYLGVFRDGSAGLFNGTMDELGFWNRNLTSAEITTLYNSSAGAEYSPGTNLVSTLNSPINYFNSTDKTITFNCSSTSDLDIENMTLFFDDIKNQTFTGGSGNLSIQVNRTLSLGDHTWNCESCDALSCINGTERNFGVTNLIINSQTFNNITTEGAVETFAINFTKPPSLQVSTIDLVYNTTVNSFPYTVTGNEVISTSSITIPAQDTAVNISFFWNVTYSDGTSNSTSTNNQSVLIIDADDCGAFSNLIYNFTQKDEEDKTTLTTNTTMEVSINLYDLSKTLLLVNFSQKFTEENPATMCLEDSLLTTVNYSAYVVVRYFANVSSLNRSYAVEYHNILNQTISNMSVPINISLLDLRQGDSTKFKLTFRDENYVLAPNILVRVYRQYVADNLFRIVEIPLTDSNGQTILNLVRNDVVYNFIMMNEARETIATFNSLKVFCQDFTIGECTINLNAPPIGSIVYNYNKEFDISITTPTYDNSTELVSLTFVTGDLKPKIVQMNVFRNNAFGNRSVCTNYLTSASGTLTCDVSAITDSDQYLFIEVYVDEELAQQYTINLNATTLRFGVLNGAFYAFLIILLLITLFMEDKQTLIGSLGIGWVIVISLGLLNGSFIGVSTAGIWLLISIVIFFWKLNKEEGL